MYVTQITIENVRAIERLRWEIAEERAAGWHVILGENGAGKSSFLRAVAMALVGPEDLGGLRQSGKDWLRQGATEGSVGVVFTRHRGFDRFGSQGAPPAKMGAMLSLKADPTTSEVSLGHDLKKKVSGLGPSRNVWSSKARGWFAAGFGPFRRFTGGEGDSENLAKKLPRLARYMSLFDERFALLDSLQWLGDLRFASLRDPHDGRFDRVTRFLNDGEFLPRGVRLVDAGPNRDVTFRDANEFVVRVEELADGFRSFLSLILELVRQVMTAFPEGSDHEAFDPANPLRIRVPGVVLIDEIDAHLHPTWQRYVGEKLCRAFPEMQFLVTTHSPLACRAADRGSVFLLPAPGEAGAGRFLNDAEKGRLVLGNLLDAYSTGAFGVGVEQSEKGREGLERLAALNIKELRDGLSEQEEAEQDELRRKLPSRASSSRAVAR